MANFKLAIIAFFLCSTSVIYGQLGFCGGSTGDAIFTESFGNGTNFGPPLAPGITTYPFVNGAPNDGFYTVNHFTNLYSSWHNSPDHSPDATDGINGKCLIVNANNNVSGEFYKRTVSGLCVNTTFEFSAWVMNVYNPNSNVCTNNQIPINVRFEIWNETQTTLLASGNTGNIFGTTSPLWQQFALVFTTVNQTSVILIMKNNGVGGCGNDLAIDDIAFKSCGDLTTVSNLDFPTNNFSTCDTNASVTLNASTSGSSTYFYQWQSSTDNENWTNIVGQNSATFITPGVSTTTFFRTKIAQDIANIDSPFCSTVSNIFTVTILPGLTPAVSNGNVFSCSSQSIPEISVTVDVNNVVNWYDQATGGALLESNSSSYTPTAAGTYYAEVFDPVSGCSGTSRTAVTLTITPEPIASFTGNLNYCSGQNTSIELQSDLVGTTFSWTTTTTNVTGAVNGSGNSINQNLSSIGGPGSVTYIVTPVFNGCPGTPINIVVNVFPFPTASFSSSSISICSSATTVLQFSGTPGAIVSFTDGSTTYNVTIDGMGSGTFTTPALSNATTYTLTNVQINNSTLCSQTVTGSVVISINQDAAITSQPIGGTICINGTVTFNVAATGVNLTYQWLFNGTPIGSATDASYTIPTATIADAGAYTVLVSGGCVTSIISETANLILIEETTIINQPQASTIICAGQPFSLSTAANGIDLTYQWFKGATPISGATAANYDIAASTVADSGIYTCQVTSISCGFITSDQAIVVVNQGPGITSQPQNNEICVGQTATFATVATGTNLTYQWFKGTTAILGATSNVYTISNAAQTDSGDYYCEISSVSCLSVTTDTVSLLVKPLPFATISQGTLSFICEGESTQIIFNGSANAIVTYTVNGEPAENITLLAGAPTILATGILDETTVYELISVTFTGANACSQDLTGSATITVNPLPSVTLEDGIICVDPITLATTRTDLLNTGLNEAEFTFEWFDTNGVIPLATNSFYQVSTIGQYGVTITNIVTGCQASAFANVTQSAPPTDFTYTVTGFFANNPTIVITATPPAAYEYQLDFGPFQDSNIFDNIAAGPHTITVRDSEACDVLSKELLIIDYPRFFTPNGDGINDVWNIQTISAISVSKIYIFDQYGRLIKEMSGTGSGWDGTYNGQMLPATDYWFTINYQEEGVSKEFRSHFSLKR